MIILTERLQTIADNIEIGERVADIGTDHGYLPLYLFEKNISTKVIMADVSNGSLLKAKENCARLFPDKEFDLRLGDGLDVLDNGEVDTVVMAGIGGLLTIDILDWDISKSLSYKKYILQPRNNGGELRRYLYEHGFKVSKLIIVPENKRLCEIMVVYSPENYGGKINSREISDYEFEFPDILKDSCDNNVKNYLQGIKELEERIINNIIAGREEEQEEDPSILDHRCRIERLDYLLGGNREN